IDPLVLDEIYKVASINLCPNVLGQIAVDCMVNPPKPGDESYEVYKGEVDEVYASLRRRALKLAAAFNTLTNVSCQSPDGAMYLFPTVRLPPRAVQEAERRGKVPDVWYALEMLEGTGV
ncbi:hypothetical protein HDU93_005445, partial [Gonapodya sp. JEL0774]